LAHLLTQGLFQTFLTYQQAINQKRCKARAVWVSIDNRFDQDASLASAFGRDGCSVATIKEMLRQPNAVTLKPAKSVP